MVGERRGTGEDTEERSTEETDNDGEWERVAMGGGLGLR